MNALLDLVCVRLCDQCPAEVYVEFDRLIRAVGKAEGERAVGRRWRSWEDNIKVKFTRIGRQCVKWVYLA